MITAEELAKEIRVHPNWWYSPEKLVAHLLPFIQSRAARVQGASDGPLSSRLRPDVECAPWVIEEVKKLERRLATPQPPKDAGAAIARAFWEVLAENLDPYDAPDFFRFLRSVKIKAERFDAEAGGTDRQTEEMCETCGYVRGSLGCDAAHKKLKELTAPPERVQIPAESEHVAPVEKVACPIPTCRAELLPGQTCGGVNCGLRGKE